MLSPFPLEPRPRLSLDDGLEEVLRRHVNLAVELHRRELDETFFAGCQFTLLVRAAEKKKIGCETS